MNLTLLKTVRNILVAAAVLALCLPAMADDNEVKTTPYPDDIVYTGTGQAVMFSHSFHAGDMGMPCSECHGEVFEMKAYAARDKGDFKMSVMQDGQYCGKCHDGTMAFSVGDYESCGRCHNGAEGAKTATGRKLVGPEEPITLGTEGSEARFPHSAHVSFHCDKCHTSLFPVKKTATITTMDDINAGKACGVCHNGTVAFDATNCGMCHPGM